jgi:ABC-type multidrug transport system fused ATPase/permease subunit
MDKFFDKFRFLGIMAFFAAIAVSSAVAMWLWNALMPDIFALPALNYWQTAGLLVLARIFLGGLGLGLFRLYGGYGRDDRLFRRGNQLREKWMHMTEEERRAFFEKERDFMRFRGGFSRFHDFSDGNGPETKQEKTSPQGGGNE